MYVLLSIDIIIYIIIYYKHPKDVEMFHDIITNVDQYFNQYKQYCTPFLWTGDIYKQLFTSFCPSISLASETIKKIFHRFKY